jgi:hypothetical protein
MPYAMSNTGKGLVGALALTLGAMGAAQLAFGRDVTEGIASSSAVSDTAVNREGKTDRAARVTTVAAPMQTIAVQLNGLAATTVVMRIPRMQDPRNFSTPLLTTSDPQKHAVACEAMVSVLTDVAKQLPPGRCVT